MKRLKEMIAYFLVVLFYCVCLMFLGIGFVLMIIGCFLVENFAYMDAVISREGSDEMQKETEFKNLLWLSRWYANRKESFEQKIRETYFYTEEPSE